MKKERLADSIKVVIYEMDSVRKMGYAMKVKFQMAVVDSVLRKSRKPKRFRELIANMEEDISVLWGGYYEG